jgi:hypothetical protein
MALEALSEPEGGKTVYDGLRNIADLQGPTRLETQVFPWQRFFSALCPNHGRYVSSLCQYSSQNGRKLAVFYRLNPDVVFCFS